MTPPLSPRGVAAPCIEYTGNRQVARIAHRAGNDRGALQQAMEAGVDWVEVDLWYSYGRLIARHERTIGRLPVVYDKWHLRVLRESLLDLGEIVRITDGGPRLFLDLKGKHRRLPSAIVNVLRRDGALDRAAVCGQYWPPLEAIALTEPRIQVFHSLGRTEHVAAYATRSPESPSSAGLSIASWLLTPDLLQNYRRQGLQVYAWTVNEPDVAARLVSWGVHGVISDRLDLLDSLP